MSRPDAAGPPRDALLPLRFEGVGLALRGVPILSGLDFELSAGGCSVVLGPNGSGKTMLLRVGHGLLAPTAGRVRWCGPGARGTGDDRKRGTADDRKRGTGDDRKRGTGGDRRRGTGDDRRRGTGDDRRRGTGDDRALRLRAQAMVLQRPVLLRRRVRANLAYPLRLRGVATPERRARVAAVLEQTHLEALADRPARSLSVGEQQRVAVARAWVVEPEVLWLDEPASALDPGATRELEETVRRIRASGTKVVMTTHDLGQARRLADEVLFLHRGRVVEKTPAGEFFDEPRSVEGRAFLKGELLP
ncbi:MAG TPA: ATP-binding cassette domain-containing protein [Myxococcota bacterium]|nr:ATP-binding cassette domain-containing protein [Myxococcota bacterium]